MPGAAVLKDVDREWQGPAANVVLITLFALAVVIYGDTLQMSSRSPFDFSFSPQTVQKKIEKKNPITVKSSPPVDHDVFIMAWREVNMEDQWSSVEKHKIDLCFLSQHRRSSSH